MTVYNSQSPEQTQKIAQEFAQKLKGGDVVFLFGNLGDGKTTFTQGLAKGLGIKKRIISPTFILMRTHRLRKKDAKFFYHLDLYRMESEKDVDGLGLDEIIGNKEAIVAIEWPEKLKDKLQSISGDIYNVYLINTNVADNERVIEIYEKER